MNITRRAVLLLLALVVVSCRTAAPVPLVDYDLKVAIYPVEGAASIASRVQTEFQQAYPQYTVTVTVADGIGLYDPATVAGWLADGTYDLVEADMILLEAIRAELETKGKPLPEWDNPPHLAQWSPAAKASSTLDGRIYGVPHYGCGYFLISTDQGLSQLKTNDVFLHALDVLPNKKKYLVAMNVAGSVTTGAVYLNGWAEQHGSLDGALDPPYDNPEVIKAMKGITTACVPDRIGTVSPCLNGEFKDKKDLQAYLEGNANTFIGFSESLRAIRLNDPVTQYYVSSAALGDGYPPLLYADSLLQRPGCVAACAGAVNAFADYYLRPTTYSWLLLGQDLPGNTPRYLVPATVNAWPDEPYYLQIHTAVTNDGGFPNAKFYGVRKDMQAEITPLIQP